MIGATVIVWFGALLFFSGMGLFALIYVAFRTLIRGRIVCYFYNKNRQFYRKLLKPDTLGILHSNQKDYIYHEELIVMSTVAAPAGLFKQWLPTLLFEEDTAIPIDIYLDLKKPKITSQNVSAAELSQILNDHSVTEFVNAQGSIKLAQVVQAIIVGMAVNVLVIGVAVWYVIKAVNEGKIS